jgi:uncharacterized protein
MADRGSPRDAAGWQARRVRKDAEPSAQVRRRASIPVVALAGASVGLLGGLIGLGGAEFRLPLLIGLFGFSALHAVILNKTMSLVVVITALPARMLSVPASDMAEHGDVALNLLAGSLLGAWLGATWATRMRAQALYQVLAILLAGIALVLYFSHQSEMTAIGLDGPALVITGIGAGLGIGVVASVMGVAGGELLIPTIVLLYGLDIKLAGSMSLLVSLPTMIVAFGRYSQDQSFSILATHRRFVLIMAAGSLVGSVIGGLLVEPVPEEVLIPALTMILLISAVKVWRHQATHNNPRPSPDDPRHHHSPDHDPSTPQAGTRPAQNATPNRQQPRPSRNRRRRSRSKSRVRSAPGGGFVVHRHRQDDQSDAEQLDEGGDLDQHDDADDGGGRG